jgi:hypothetical protein
VILGRNRRGSYGAVLSTAMDDARSTSSDEGGPLEAGSQVQASNRCKLQPSRAAVVSVAGKPERDFGRYDPERRAQANRR